MSTKITAYINRTDIVTVSHHLRGKVVGISWTVSCFGCLLRVSNIPLAAEDGWKEKKRGWKQRLKDGKRGKVGDPLVNHQLLLDLRN